MSAIDCCVCTPPLFVKMSSKHSLAWSSHVHVSTNACACAVFLPDVVVNLIVIALGIKRRIDVTKINCFIADESPQNIEIIHAVKFVHQKTFIECRANFRVKRLKKGARLFCIDSGKAVKKKLRGGRKKVASLNESETTFFADPN
jgi:hypothetical protein